MSGGTLSTGNFELKPFGSFNTFTYSGGTIAVANFTVDASETLSISGAVSRVGNNFVNKGTTNDASTQDLQLQSSMTNQGILNLQVDHGLTGPKVFLINQGTFEKTGGTGTSSINNLDFVNDSTFNINTGTVQFTWWADQNTGTTTLENATTLTTPSGNSYTLDGGTLTTTGNATINGSLDVAAAASVVLGDGLSTLTVTGNYTQAGSLTVAVNINGNTNSQLAVQGTASLGGSLVVNVLNNPPNLGQTFDIITYGGVQGNFTNATSGWKETEGANIYQIEWAGD